MYTIIKKPLKKMLNILAQTRLSVVLSFAWTVLTWIEYAVFQIKWRLCRKRPPALEKTKQLCEQCTIVFKSFERQKMAKRLYNNIQKYYHGIKVIIADDSRTPLNLQGEFLTVLNLPFNSGLSYGLNRALEIVTTPYVIRMDDDELLTPFSRFEKQLEFLNMHPEVDLVGILPFNIPILKSMNEAAEEYYKQPMGYAPKPLKIPHMTQIDNLHCVLGKVPNIFIARTEKVKEIGYDDNIRMIDHNEFFYRAAGNLVAVLDTSCFVIHYHNRYDMNYQRYRRDILGDKMYIYEKMRKAKDEA